MINRLTTKRLSLTSGIPDSYKRMNNLLRVMEIRN